MANTEVCEESAQQLRLPLWSKARSSWSSSHDMAQRPAFPRSHILIFGPSSVQTLLPVTLISQAEALLENHQIKDVIELADKQRKKVQGKFVVDPDEVPVP
jgi:hypothetical protein